MDTATAKNWTGPRSQLTAMAQDRDKAIARAEAAEAERDEWNQAATRHHSNPADHRYWEGRYRDEKARTEAAEARVSELEGALREYMDHDADYAQINALGDHTQSHRWKRASTALNTGDDNG